MARNPRRNREVQAPATSASSPTGAQFSPLAKKWIWMGIGFVLLGFFLVTHTDPAGANWASHVAPLLLVGGYAAIGIGLSFLKPQ